MLSYLGIPASLAVSTTSTIIGLGWGRASRAATLAELATPPPERAAVDVEIATGALAASRAEEVPASLTIGDIARHEKPAEKPAEVPSIPEVGAKGPVDLDQKSLFDPAAAKRIVTMWILTPSLAVAASYPTFLLLQ